jgi:hypothetical protein
VFHGFRLGVAFLSPTKRPHFDASVNDWFALMESIQQQAAAP